MPIFLLAGQSNMVGNVDQSLFNNLLGELTASVSAGLESRLVEHLRYWYIDTNNSYASYGYSTTMATFEASELVRLRGAGLVGNQLTQPHPKVMCSTNGSVVAPLATNCGSPFGPELVMGHALAKSLASPTSLIKVALGGTTMQVDWRSPRRGEPVGEQYKQLSARIKSLANTPASVHPDCVFRKCQWAAFVFFQGENDSFDAASAAAYEQNLRDMVADVRAEVGAASLPVVVVQVGKWAQSLPHGGTVAAAQQAYVRTDTRSRLVDTSDLSGFYHYDPAAQLIIGERVANAVQQLMSARP
jgi:hypothetical protein